MVEILTVSVRTSELLIAYFVHVVGMSLSVFLDPKLPKLNVIVALSGVAESRLR